MGDMATKKQRQNKQARRAHHAAQSRVANIMADELQNLTVAKLKEIAKKAGLVFPAKARKDVLVDGILNAKIRKLENA